MITQNNLDKFCLKFVASEFQYNSLRFDTLAFDENSASIVIIEYKNELSTDILNQGKKYYNNLLENKREYVDRFNSVFNKSKRDFDRAKVMIVATEFSDDQISSSKNPNYSYELWKVALNENNRITYKNFTEDRTATVDVKPNELTITEDELLNDKTENVHDLYHALKNRISHDFDKVAEKIIIDTISFRTNNKIVCLANIKTKIKIYLFTKNLDDPKDKTRDISDITTWENCPTMNSLLIRLMIWII